MFETIDRSWRLAKMSFGIIRDHRALLIFPVLSGLAGLIVTASFIVPAALLMWTTEDVAVAADDGELPIVEIVLLFAFYFSTYFVTVFFNTALIACVMQALDGRPPRVRDGIELALNRLPQILGWSMIAAAVGVILKSAERNRRGGGLVLGLLGMAWSALTFFVVPVLVVENVGPIAAIKRSGAIIRSHWGTALVSKFSVGLIGVLLALPAVFIGGAILALGVASESTVVIVAALALAFLWFVLLGVVLSAADVIVKALVYNHAAERSLPPRVDRDELERMFEQRP